jgi:hypothetical protein
MTIFLSCGAVFEPYFGALLSIITCAIFLFYGIREIRARGYFQNEFQEYPTSKKVLYGSFYLVALLAALGFLFVVFAILYMLILLQIT